MPVLEAHEASQASSFGRRPGQLASETGESVGPCLVQAGRRVTTFSSLCSSFFLRNSARSQFFPREKNNDLPSPPSGCGVPKKVAETDHTVSDFRPKRFTGRGGGGSGPKVKVKHTPARGGKPVSLDGVVVELTRGVRRTPCGGSATAQLCSCFARLGYM